LGRRRIRSHTGRLMRKMDVDENKGDRLIGRESLVCPPKIRKKGRGRSCLGKQNTRSSKVTIVAS